MFQTSGLHVCLMKTKTWYEDRQRCERLMEKGGHREEKEVVGVKKGKKSVS